MSASPPVPAAPALPSEALPQPAPARPPGMDPAQGQRRLHSGELFHGAAEVEIVHREQVYRLRQTALGKLILTK